MSKKNSNSLNGASMLRQLKEVPGLFTCLLEHSVTKTTAQFKWEGPKIPPDEWKKMLSFFQWTYDTHHSESQVRWYVNRQLNTWRVWAYPQEADTGMSARELEGPAAAQQREQFSSTDGWLYFGTTHHHCNMGAFQSPTDENNEKNQDGLHITVGNMSQAQYQLHERFYISGRKIDHDLSWFWDIGEALADVPAWAARLLPEDIEDRLARGQMITKATPDIEVPQQWKDNVIARPKPVAVITTGYSGGLGYGKSNTGIYQRKYTNSAFDLRQARIQLLKLCVDQNLDEVDALADMKITLAKDPFMVELIHLMYRNDVSLDKLAEFVEDEIIHIREGAAKVEAADAQRQLNGIPDHMGSAYGNLPEM